MRTSPLLCLVLVLTSPTAAPQEPARDRPSRNWPQFRGYRARGIVETRGMPAEWDVPKGESVVWRTPVPGLAHSSPIVWGERVFVTSAVRKKGEAKLKSLYGSPGYGAGESVVDEGELDYRLYCLDKQSGKVLWKATAHTGVPRVKRHPKSSHANPTPAANGDRVVVSFGSEGLYCFAHSGRFVWKRDLGVLNCGAPGYKTDNFQWGYASSPIIYTDRVFVQCDHEGDSFVAALNLADGKDVWRVEREEASTWCTPTVHESAATGTAQLIVNGYKHIGGYDLDSGEEIWKLVGGGDVPVPTPVVVHDLIFLTSAHGRSSPIRAVDVRAKGTLGSDPDEEEHLVWQHARGGIYMQTPLVYGDLLYLCSDGGVLTCYEAKSGKRVYRKRVGKGLTGFSGSAVAADGKIYFSGEAGQVFVVKAGREFEVLATNEMGETCMATPAISDGMLFFRTRKHVVAIKR